MRGWNRKPIHPPQTIVDVASIVHEMRVMKSAEELEIMQTAADIAAEAHVEAMKAARPGMQEYQIERVDRTDLSQAWCCWSGVHVDRRRVRMRRCHYINNDGEQRRRSGADRCGR